MALQDAWKRFIGTPYFRIVYIVVMALLTALLFPFAFGAAACLALLVIPLTIFVVPYWFGERRPRRLVVNGLVVFAIALPIVGAFQTGAVLDLPPFELSSFAFPGENTTMSLTNGTAAPYRVEGPANVTFRVLLTTTDNATPADFAVWLNLTRVDGFAFNAETFPMAPEPPVGNNTRNGTWFTVNATVPSAVVGTGFSVERQSDENWTRTGVYLGPITGSWGTYFGYFVLFSAPLLGLTLAFYLMILFMWWYTVRMRSRTVRRVPETEPEPAEEAAPAPASGTAGKAAAFTCTNCGADVGDDAVKCPKCGATFED